MCRHRGLECRLIELPVAEGREGRRSALHSRDESLLAHDGVIHVAEPGFLDEVQALLRLAPDRVARIVPQEEDCDALAHAVASGGETAIISLVAEARPPEFEHGPD